MCLGKQTGETEKNGSTDEDNYAGFYKGEWDNIKRGDKGKS